MSYIQSRPGLSKQLELVGASDAGASGNISPDIQRVYISDDLRNLVPPVAFPTTYVTQLAGAAAAGNANLIDIFPPSNGPAIFTFIRNDSADPINFAVVKSTEMTNVTTAATHNFGNSTGVSDPSQSPAFITRGEKAFTAGYTSGLQIAAGASLDAAQLGAGLVVNTGQLLGFSQSAVTNNLEITVIFRMIPARK